MTPRRPAGRARLCSHDRACAAPAQAVNVPLHGSPSHSFAHLGFREKNNTSTGTYTRKEKERMPAAKRTVFETSSAYKVERSQFALVFACARSAESKNVERNFGAGVCSTVGNDEWNK